MTIAIKKVMSDMYFYNKNILLTIKIKLSIPLHWVLLTMLARESPVYLAIKNKAGFINIFMQDL